MRPLRSPEPGELQPHGAVQSADGVKPLGLPGPRRRKSLYLSSARRSEASAKRSREGCKLSRRPLHVRAIPRPISHVVPSISHSHFPDLPLRRREADSICPSLVNRITPAFKQLPL